MENLFRSQEIAKRYDIPTKTAYNWSRDKETWRMKLYRHLEKCYARELAEKAKDI